MWENVPVNYYKRHIWENGKITVTSVFYIESQATWSPPTTCHGPCIFIGFIMVLYFSSFSLPPASVCLVSVVMWGVIVWLYDSVFSVFWLLPVLLLGWFLYMSCCELSMCKGTYLMALRIKRLSIGLPWVSMIGY